MTAHWSMPYVGLPWLPMGRTAAGCDCWGLVRLIYQEVAQIDLDPLDGRYVTAEERADIAAIIRGERATGQWVPVELGGEADLDVIVLHWLGFQSHVGVVAGRGLMLHAMAGQPSGVVRYLEGRWRPRITGIFRHRMRA